MSRLAAFERILASLHDAMLNDARWPGTSALIDEACQTKGNSLVVADGVYPDAVDLHLVGFYFHGERDHAMEREYFDLYYPQDERIPRLIELPDSQLIPVADLYTDDELKTSEAYNEALSRGQAQNGLNVRLDGPSGSRITWMFADPADAAGGWSPDQIELIRELLPQLRQYVRVRRAIADAGAFGNSLTGLLDKTGAGIIHLDRHGRIAAMNDRARDLLRGGDALFDQGRQLAARLSADNDALQELLARALPRFGGVGMSGSLTLSRPNNSPGLSIHVSPIGGGEIDFPPWRVAAVVLLVDHSPARIDPALVQAALGLTPTEGLVAALLAEGMTPGISLPRWAARKEPSVGTCSRFSRSEESPGRWTSCARCFRSRALRRIRAECVPDLHFRWCCYCLCKPRFSSTR